MSLALTACGPGPVYSAKELDERPFPLAPVDVDFPRTSGPAEFYGKLELDLVIGADGRVEKVDVARADVPKPFLDAALKAFSEARWEPGKKGGRAVRSLKRVEVDFQPPPMREGRPPMQPEQ